jgi:Cof subfamily protein (haloacid dehalogenase superfamily)
MYKAVFIDLDGTLLRADHSMSEATRNTIQKLIAKNILVVLVSARPYHGITPISAWLGTGTLPIVSLNGAYIRLNDEVIFESCLDLKTVSELHLQAKHYDTTLIYYTGLNWYAEKANAATAKEQRITNVKVTVAPFESLMQDWSIRIMGLNKIMAIGAEKVIAAQESKLLSIFQQRLNIYTSKPTYLEIMKDASKSSAVKYLLERFQISREESLAIGDNFNDREMIIYAGTGVAMGNAPDAIKAVADHVTDSNQNDGVRKAIEKFIPL